MVSSPRSMPKLSFRTFATGASPLVVQEAFETTWCLAGSYLPSLTPRTIVMSSFFAGAEMMTFLAPPDVTWPRALVASVKSPVDSITRSTPMSAHLIFSRSRSAVTVTRLPSTSRWPSLAATEPA